MNSRNITISSLFGLLIFFQKFLLPPPYDKIISIFIQITLLSLVFLVTGVTGPILTSLISGLLTASMRIGLPLMTFSFALLYGVLVSSFNHLFRVVTAGQLSQRRLMASAFISTMLVGVFSSIVTIALGMIPYNPALVLVIMLSGGLQGIVGGYLSSIIWIRYFRK